MTITADSNRRIEGGQMRMGLETFRRLANVKRLDLTPPREAKPRVTIITHPVKREAAIANAKRGAR
jgi:hypothetical protein